MSRLSKLIQSNHICAAGSKSSLCPDCCWFGGYSDHDLCTFAFEKGIKQGIAVFRLARKLQ